MNLIKVKPGAAEDVSFCERALQNSVLSGIYFTTAQFTRTFIFEAVERKELFIVFNEQGDALGFMRIAANGAFSNFPFLHLIAVCEKYRGKGYGSAMLEYFEKMFASHKLFLLVCEHNEEAYKLYKRKGYSQIETIPDLYCEGVHELLMMKKT